MKKILILFLICTFAAQLTAQPSTEIQKQQQRSQRYQQIQSAKIAFFTAELELTPKEATEFWPLYNEYWKALETANRNSYHALRKLSQVLNDNEAISDSQLMKLMETHLAGSEAESRINKKYYPLFIKLLSVKKVAKLFKAEEDFRIEMIHQLRSGGHEEMNQKNK